MHYLNYVLCFIDDEFKIFDSLNDTFCSASISDENDDSFLKNTGNSYQFSIYCDNCYVQLLKTDNKDAKIEKSWMKPFLRDYLKIIQNSDEQTLIKFIIDKDIAHSRLKIFYVREINIKMKVELFEKIISNPNNHTKQYTSEDLFNICSSYAFTVFDNQYIILKNILFLITEDLFYIDEIHQICIDMLIKWNIGSDMLRKFESEIFLYDYDLQSKIEKFITNHCDSLPNDKFLLGLHQWKCSITNMFILIQRTFCFHVISSDDCSVMKIRNNVCLNLFFDISINKIHSILPLLNENCIFSYRSFTSVGTDILFSVYDIFQMENFKIDITDFYKKLYVFEKLNIIRENMKFQKFILSVLQKTGKILFFNVGIHQFIIEQNNSDQYPLISHLSDDNHFCFDENIFISKKILEINSNEIEFPLKKMAKLMIKHFSNLETYRNKKISFIFSEQENHSSKYSNNFTYRLQVEQSLKMKLFDNWRYNSSYTIFIDEKTDQVPQIIGMKNYSSKIRNIINIVGLIDKENVFLILNQSSNKENFVLQPNDSLNQQTTQNFKSKFRTRENFDSFNVSSCSKCIVSFKIHSILKSNNSQITEKHSESSSHPNNNAISPHYTDFVNNCTKQELSAANHSKLIRVHHFNQLCALNEIFDSSYEINSIKSSRKRPKKGHFGFEVKFSNFRLTIANFIELESINKDLSYFEKRTESSFTFINAKFCRARFFPNTFYNMNGLYLYFCRLTSCLILNHNTSTQQNFFLRIQDSTFIESIIILNFIKIKSMDKDNVLSLNKNSGNYFFHIRNCQIEFLDDIPNCAVQIHLYECKIQIHKNILYFNKTLSKNKSTNLELLSGMKMTRSLHRKNIVSLVIHNCILPYVLKICGIFQTFHIMNCVSNFEFEFANIIKITNHSGQFSIKDLVIDAISRSNENLFDKGKYICQFNNLEIFELKNLKIDMLILRNCVIHKIKNIKCMDIDIMDTKCAFILKNASKIQQYCSDTLNLKKYQNIYMSLEEFQ